MTRQEVRVIVCPRNRCKDCQKVSGLECTDLVKFRNDTATNSVLLIERNRHLIHLSDSSEMFTQAPWYRDGWDTIHIHDGKILEDSETIVDAYSTGPYFSVFFKEHDSKILFYESYPIVRSPLESALVEELENDLALILEKKPMVRMKLTDRLDNLALLISRKILESLPEINDITRERISRIVANYSTAVGPMIPILLDDEVEELYLDGPSTPLYFDHAKYGRVRTSLMLDARMISRLMTLLRAESNLHLDRKNPSLKTDLNILGSSLRVSVSAPPLTPDGLHLEIRRAREKPLSLIDLVKNGTLTLDAASVLMLALSCRFNITITGEPGAGKTTLLNALDMSSPRGWRKIYIEDAIESRTQLGHHQVRIRVDPLDEADARFNKETEIVKSLHRSPDYLILGEIQTTEHSRSLFQAMAAGLRTIQTCHSYSAASLLSRWVHNHEIKNSSLAMIDLIVTLKRPVPGESLRKVTEIVEVRKSVIDGLLRFEGLNTIFSLNTPGPVRWAEDGAFHFHAKQEGFESHIPVYEAIANILRESVLSREENREFHLSEKLWEFGHPLKVVNSES